LRYLSTISLSSSNRAIVQESFGVMTDQPLVLDRRTTGSTTIKGHVAPGLTSCDVYVVRWTGMITEATDNVQIQLHNDVTANLGTLHYRPEGDLAYNGFGNVLSVGYEPNVPQVFEITVEVPNGTTSLSIDGVPVPEAQNKPNVQNNSTDSFESMIFAIAGLEYEEYVIDDFLITATGCDVPTEKSSWSKLKANY
jgi:hypothetical protein